MSKRVNENRFSKLMEEEFGEEVIYKPKVSNRRQVLNSDEG